MAAGDIISCTIRSDGWSMDVVVDGVTPTGTTYDYGYTGTTLGTPKISLAVTSKGFDETGAATTYVRTIHATKTVRQAYPSNASLQETNNGDGTMTVRVALSETVYAKDKAGTGNSGTDVAVTFLSGWLVKSPTTSAAASITATNNSTRAYPKIACKRVWFNYEKIQASTYTFECIPVSPLPFWNGTNRPFACVKATMTDESANSVAATITKWDLSPRSGDAVSVVTCSHSFSLSTMDKQELCTIHFQVYPWIGDSTEVVDTTSESDRDVELTGPVYFFCDKDSDYPSSIAYVDVTSGNDTTGVAAAIGGDATASASPFKTVINAREAIVARNLAQYGRQDLNGAVIYLKEGTHKWVGDNTINARSDNKVLRNTDKCELLITRDPNGAKANVIVNEYATFGADQNQIKTQNYRIYDITIGVVSSSPWKGTTTGNDVVTFHNCSITTAINSRRHTQGHKVVQYVQCSGSTDVPLIGTTSTAVERVGLIRGLSGGSGSCDAHMILGCSMTKGTFLAGNFSHVMVWMNRLEIPDSRLDLSIVPTSAISRYIVAGNCLVAWGNTTVLPHNVCAEGATAGITDSLFAYNSFLGGAASSPFENGRLNWMYSASTNNNTKHACNLFNYFRNINHKTDVFYTDGTLVSNWSETYGVFHVGSVCSGQTVANFEFNGRDTAYVSNNSLTIDFSNPTDSSTGAAGGGYIPGNSSALLNRVRSSLAFIPYDISGHARSYDGTGAAGAYANLLETQASSGGGAVNMLLMGVG